MQPVKLTYERKTKSYWVYKIQGPHTGSVYFPLDTWAPGATPPTTLQLEVKTNGQQA
jgi:hypothetical protein